MALSTVSELDKTKLYEPKTVVTTMANIKIEIRISRSVKPKEF
jgi:hypothetical protein